MTLSYSNDWPLSATLDQGRDVAQLLEWNALQLPMPFVRAQTQLGAGLPFSEIYHVYPL